MYVLEVLDKALVKKFNEAQIQAPQKCLKYKHKHYCTILFIIHEYNYFITLNQISRLDISS